MKSFKIKESRSSANQGGKWSPPQPLVKFEERGDYMYTLLVLYPSPGAEVKLVSRVHLPTVEQHLRDGQTDSIEGFFGRLWRNIKHVGKNVGKAKGLKAVLKAAKGVVKIIPGIGNAVSAIDAASDVATGLVAKGAGRNDLAKQAFSIAKKRAKAGNLDKEERRQVAKMGAQIYELIIQPK